MLQGRIVWNKTGNARNRNIEARSCNHRCNGKAITITQPECVPVATGIQHAPYCHSWLDPLYTQFFLII
jgi:hypothetical protein